MTIRFLDPPLHEFLPTMEQTKQISEIASEMGVSRRRCASASSLCTNSTPCWIPRLPPRMVFSEIYEMQVRAIFEAAQN